MTFVRRRIDVTITLGTGSFGETVGDTVTLTNHRVIVEQATFGGDAQGQIQVAIYGLTLAMINRLTCVGPTQSTIRGKNSIMVAAGDDGEAMTTVFIGTIDQAWGDFQSAPDVVFNVLAYSAMVAAVKPVAASSYRGDVDAATVMRDLAKLMDFAFEPNGVSVMLSNPYFPGTALDQVKACARAANIDYSTDNKVLAIRPKGKPRAGVIPLISPKTGMVGYPVFSSNGIGVTSIFNPSIRYGGRIDVDSSIQPACGRWIVLSVVLRLESERPGGAWFSFVNANRDAT